MSDPPYSRYLCEAHAPAKTVLFGEHAVLQGHPALAVALDLHTSCRAYPAEDGQWRVNGHPISLRRDLYILKAVDILGGEPLHLSTRSRIPSAAGLGSSASITAASVASILGARKGFSREECLRTVQQAETAAEKEEACLLDAACVCMGGGIVANPGKMALEQMEVDDEEWPLGPVPLPELNLVMGFSGVKGRTREVVKNISAFNSHQSTFSNEILGDIGEVARQGIEALMDGDLALVGELMYKNHRLLATLGINTPEIQRLVEASKRHGLGAKITGAGGGGCIVVLTEDVDDTAEAITRAGGVPILANVEEGGVVVRGGVRVGEE